MHQKQEENISNILANEGYGLEKVEIKLVELAKLTISSQMKIVC